jgi:hypothetical protein
MQWYNTIFAGTKEVVKQEHISVPSIPGPQNRLDVDKLRVLATNIGHYAPNLAPIIHTISSHVRRVKLIPLPYPPVRARTDARTNPSAQRATQLMSVLARVYAVSRQNQLTTTVP